MRIMDENKKSRPYKPLPKQWVGCDIEESFFGDDRKLSKKERKIAAAKDRSKYKKTDRDQSQKQPAALHLVESSEKGLFKGRVLSIKSEGIIVEYQHHLLLCSLRGLLKKEKSQFKNIVTVGDWVLFERKGEKEGIILQIQPRHSILSRADNLSRRKEQLIAANVDQVLITLSVVSPSLKLGLSDRYIIAAQKGNMAPIILFNKMDLLNKSPGDPNVQKERELFIELATAYRHLKIPVGAVSVATGEGLDELKAIMKDKTSVFSGQSGVGKSSLINKITGLELETKGIVEKTQKGSHTTSSAQLIPLDFGGWCIDTPGIKSFGVWDLSKDEIEQYFTEIFLEGHQCRYPDCAHIHENECAVKKAVEEGRISSLRYMSYFSLIHDIAQEHVRR
jgi:ribosome biogenesis GTPase